jgi:hypothetical protein
MAVPGTKEKPFNVPYGAVQVDGTAVEFNINPAVTSHEFIRNIQSVMKTLREMTAETTPGYVFSDFPVAVFDETYFETIPDFAKELGCNPDFDAWMQQPNVPPDCSQPMRTAAGHIHIGWTENHEVTDVAHVMDCMAVARQLDYYVGMPSLIWDHDNRRRTMYGRAGACRIKPYGVEYRVPSNAWLRSEKLMKFVFDNSVKATRDLFDGKSAESMYQNHAQDIINCNVIDWHTTVHGKNLSQAVGLDLSVLQG